MRTSCEKLVHKVGTKYVQNISNDLNSKSKENLVTPVHLTEVLVRHDTREALVRTDQSKIQAYRRAQESILRAAATAEPSDAEIPTKIVMIENEITKGDYDLSNKIPIDMSESEKTAYGNEWHT